MGGKEDRKKKQAEKKTATAGKADSKPSPTASTPSASSPSSPLGAGENFRVPSGATVQFRTAMTRDGVRDIMVEHLDLNFKGHELLHETTLELNYGRRYGLVGPNGCGKSTLLNVLGAGEIPFPPRTDWFHLHHEIEASDMSSLEAVLSVDTEKARLEESAERLQDQLGGADDDAINSRLAEIYERLEELDADTAEARAAAILNGLGFTPAMQQKKTRDFSGGWRMRIALAQALFQAPTLLILDEPTNHLDIEAVVWLESYLSKFGKILLMVSHSQDFLNTVCTNIIRMHQKQLVYYKGNYDMYCRSRAELEENQMKKFTSEQDEIKKMKDYVARFGHGSAKLARQAQSKEKVIAKMERSGLTEAVTKDRVPEFFFPDPQPLPPPVLCFQDVSFNYPNGPTLYQNLNFGLDLDSRVALVGPNGAGKTTLQKLMTFELEPTSGMVTKNAHLVFTRFNQHFVDQLDMTTNPLQFMLDSYPDQIQEKEKMRSFLGRFGLSGAHQLQQIATLSDGQKARVVFAWMAMRGPHIILLDEPTNHLDMESIDALADALMSFTGGVVLVSHDMRLIQQVAKEIWIVDDKTVRPFPGDIRSYKSEVASRIQSLKEKEERGGKK